MEKIQIINDKISLIMKEIKLINQFGDEASIYFTKIIKAMIVYRRYNWP